MSLVGGIGKHGNPVGADAPNSAGLPKTWWLVPAVLVGVFLLGRKAKQASK